MPSSWGNRLGGEPLAGAVLEASMLSASTGRLDGDRIVPVAVGPILEGCPGTARWAHASSRGVV